MTEPHESKYHFEHAGTCEICEKPTTFIADHPYFRNSLKCVGCDTVPRQRAIWRCLNRFAPDWRNLAVHESSPGWDRASQRLTAECANYVSTQFNPSRPLGEIVPDERMLAKKYRNENLECQTFEGNKFDVVITQDVFEHIFRPDLAIKEIARTLKPGGVTIMTVPLVNRHERPSQRRASLTNGGEIIHHLEAQYHGNPISDEGALVVVDWGYDIVAYLQAYSGLSFILMETDNIDLGIRADLCEVLVGFKRPIPSI